MKTVEVSGFSWKTGRSDQIGLVFTIRDLAPGEWQLSASAGAFVCKSWVSP